MWIKHYNANTVHKESWPREIWIGYNIELAEYIYLLRIVRQIWLNDLTTLNLYIWKKPSLISWSKSIFSILRKKIGCWWIDYSLVTYYGLNDLTKTINFLPIPISQKKWVDNWSLGDRWRPCDPWEWDWRGNLW